MKKIPDYSKYITTNGFNKFLREVFDEKLKEEKLVFTNHVNTVKELATKMKKTEKL